MTCPITILYSNAHARTPVCGLSVVIPAPPLSRFLKVIIVFHWRFWVFNGDYSFSLTIMVFQWQLWAFIGNYGFLIDIMGLTLFLCIYQDLIYFFTIDPLGSKLTCYLFKLHITLIFHERASYDMIALL